ncbi:unnamed protein product [Arabis nemorensis]|uniref:Peptidase C1A papain C-terminal domain-containing protein n=1 Tax=Arabis nemorensis TaxID=586526 RepID=A0A565B4H4_9BRAS|nr:unnamed protein product [Arabis nemorensis]
MNQGITGGKASKSNQRSQAKENAKARKVAEASSPSQVTKEPTLEELFSGIIYHWASANGQIVGGVIDQGKREICWAICLARLLQALYNMEHPHDQITFSFDELVGQIKQDKEEKSLGLANLKKAFAHISVKGMLKTPTKGVGMVGDKGKKVQENFHLYEDVDFSNIRERLDRSPVALRLEIKNKLSSNRGEIYYLPKKGIITKNTRLHCILLIGYGMTEQGELYFIGQNSWGELWGRQGYVRIVINHKCDIICRKD